MTVSIPNGDEAASTRSVVPITSGVDGPVIGEVLSIYSDGDCLMANCMIDGNQEVIRLGQGDDIPMSATYYVVDDSDTGIRYLEEGLALPNRGWQTREQ